MSTDGIVYCGCEGAKASRAEDKPVNHLLPIWAAKFWRLGTNPAARRNFFSKWEMVSDHPFGLAPIRSKIGIRWASMVPGLSDRIMRPDLSTRLKYSSAVIGRIPWPLLSDEIGHSQLLGRVLLSEDLGFFSARREFLPEYW